jgi:hypothetical protein
MFLQRSSPLRFAFLAVAVGAVATGCSTTAAGDAGASGAIVLADSASFSCFRNWPSTPGVGPAGAPDPSAATDGGIHAGPMTTYINMKPPHGSTSFPVGTIIVKEQNDPPLMQRQIFAMVKRGGDYNAAGAVNWEFFELQNMDSCNVSIVWSRIPLGTDPYASNPNVCNDCHFLAQSNDYVWTKGLSLSSF